MEKRCFACKETKDAKLFNKNKGKKDGLQSRCKKCQKEYHNNVWYPRNREKLIPIHTKKKKARRKEHWTRVIELYFLKGCVDCGIKNVKVLEFDHVRGRKVNGVGTMIQDNYGWDSIKKEIDKCEVRCRNCHRLKTFKQFNWHKDIEAFNK